MQIRHVKHTFKPVIDGGCKILILGSVPSVKSSEAGFYYMHGQNRFWAVMSALLGENLVGADAAEKTRLLLKHHVALYDSVEECDVLGSADSTIKNVVPADISSLIAGAAITKIFCNGATSYNLFIKYNPQIADMATRLPSTSPANAAHSLTALINEWSAILPALND